MEARSVDFAGLSYAVNDDLSLMFYASEAKDVWRQYFANLNYNIPLSDSQALNFDLVAYKTRDEGEARAGELDTLTWSLKGCLLYTSRPDQRVRRGGGAQRRLRRPQLRGQ